MSMLRRFIARFGWLAVLLFTFGFVGQAIGTEVPPVAAVGATEFRGYPVWEVEITVGTSIPGFLGYVVDQDGARGEGGFVWEGKNYTVTSVLAAPNGEDRDKSHISLYVWPGLPQESNRLFLQVGDLRLNLADGRVAGQHFFWPGVDLNWSMGDTVDLSIWEYPRHFEPRAFDGRGNNVAYPTWGAADTTLLRKTGVTSYADGVSEMTVSRPNPRTISNHVLHQGRSVLNSRGSSDMVWQWGQFIDHDITLSLDNPDEPIPVTVPRGDVFFDPGRTGQAFIQASRSESDPRTGTGPENPRRQINVLTAFVDGSGVYGSDSRRAYALRTNDGTGRLRTSFRGLMLPFNQHALENEGGSHRSDLFVAGDVRVNEQIGLISVHTLFVREHNRLAEELADRDPGLSGEDIYQIARKIVGAEIQAVTYNEFLPQLLGSDTLDPYTGYDPTVDPTIASEFSAAAYRVGHTLLSPKLLLVDDEGQRIQQSLAESFFTPAFIRDNGISMVLRGLAGQKAQEVDSKVISEVRNFLLRGPMGPRFDLVSLNIQRGRDHGLADFNTVKQAYGLDPVESFADISSDADVQSALRSVYGDISDLDLWVTALAEDHVPGTSVGETLQAIIADQFRRLRDGDRLWFENDPYFLAHPTLMEELRSVTLADIIRRNTPIDNEISNNVFTAPDTG